MTLTLELPEELEKALEKEAQRRGVETAQLALEALEKVVQPARPKKVLKAYGMFAGSSRTVDDFLRERHEEVDREEQQTPERAARWRAIQEERRKRESAKESL